MREFTLQFFLKVGDLLLTIPVNPEELEVTKELGYDSYANLDKKEILKLQEDKLVELELESILEQTVSSASVTSNPWTPQKYLNTFNGWKDNRTIVRVTSSDGQIDFEGYIVEVTTTYEGGTDDYNYLLKIVQERSIELLTNIDNNYSKIDIEYQVLRYTPKTNPTAPVETNTGTSNPSNSNNNQTVTYTVKKGDTLSGIAKMYYGNSSKWPDIFNANKDKIKNANLIYPGQVLTIPNSDGTVKSTTSSSNTKSTTTKSSSTTKSTSTTTKQDKTTKTSGNEGKDHYKKIQGVEFWGVGTFIEEYNDPKNMRDYYTYFFYDSGTYQTTIEQYYGESTKPKTTSMKVGYISSYSYYNKKK